ncbi:hypothetical protein AGMMS49953_10060 [Endomicrobiia bacterium]|nr:hypothetical protein AGMMS49953_10060 [Endomicrobiia bacterium]
MKKLIAGLILLMFAGCGYNKKDVLTGFTVGFAQGVEATAKSQEYIDSYKEATLAQITEALFIAIEDKQIQEGVLKAFEEHRNRNFEVKV